MEELEEIRTKLKNKYIIGTIVIILVALILSLIIYPSAAFAIFIPIVFIGIIIMIIATSKLNMQYKKTFKEVFVLKSLKERFTDLNYNPDIGINIITISKTKMINMGNKYHSEDYISAKYKDIKFEQADVHIQEEHTSTDANGHTTTSYVTLFKGRWMIFDFNKKFKADVQISEKGFGSSKVKTLFGKKEELFKKVSMESESFNKKFNVFAQNEHDAFYIITPSLMDRIEKLDNIVKGKLLLCFIDNRLHIGLYDNKDSFEPESVFKTINEEETIARISNDIDMITQFVDQLNLENNLFKKEV